MRDPTPRQLEIWRTMRLLRARVEQANGGRGYNATMREIASELGLNHVTIWEHVQDLVSLGWAVKEADTDCKRRYRAVEPRFDHANAVRG